MARRQGVKGSPSVGWVGARGSVRRGSAAVGVGAFLALGSVVAPPAQADELDWLSDLFDPSVWSASAWDSTPWWDSLDLAWNDPLAGAAFGSS